MNYFLDLPKRFAKSVATKCFFGINGGYDRAFCRLIESREFTAESMVLAYIQGMFPLGQPDGRIHWQTPDERAVVAVDDVHVSKRVKTYLNKQKFTIKYNTEFETVVENCAGRDETWINQALKDVYLELYQKGVCHSVEAYEDGELVGGGFGLAIGDVFFLESMYCSVDQASKIAFIELSRQLKEDGFAWIDCQYLSEHWKRFGCKPVSREALVELVTQGLSRGARFGQSLQAPVSE